MAVPLKLDITTGDKITPQEIEYQFKLLLEDRSIMVFAYNLYRQLIFYILRQSSQQSMVLKAKNMIMWFL